MIRPIDEYEGKVDPVSSQYPDGKARNISAPGDGTGTPLEAKWLNDVFGVLQYLTSKAGITPSGTPENAETSQVFESMWQLLNARVLTYNLTADANYSLTADQNLYKNIVITDTGVVLTTGRDIIVDTVGKVIVFKNSTAQTLTVKTAAGTGIEVPPGFATLLLNDGTNISLFLTAGQTWDGVDYVDPDAVGGNPSAKIYPDGTVIGSTDNGKYIKYPNGELEISDRTYVSVPIGNNNYSFPTPIQLVSADDLRTSQYIRGTTGNSFEVWLDSAGTNVNTVSVGVANNFTSALLVYVEYIGKGRWK